MALRRILCALSLALVSGTFPATAGWSLAGEDERSTDRTSHTSSTRKDQYGQPLPDLAVARVRLSPDVGRDPDNRVAYWHSLAMSQDGKRLAFGRWGVLYLWDVRGQRQIRQWRGEQGDFKCLAFSPNGRALAFSGADGFIYFRSINNDDPARRLPERPFNGIGPMAFSPDGKLLAAVGAKDHAVLILDVPGLREVRRLTIPGGGSQVAFSPDGKVLAVAGWGPAVVHLWDVASGKKLREVGETGRYPVPSVAFAPDSRTLAAPGASGPFQNEDAPTIFLREATTGRELRQFPREQLPQEKHWRYVESLAFSPDGRTLASAENEYVFLWEAATGKQILCLTGHHNRVFFIGFAPDGRVLISGSEDGTALVWDFSLLGTGGPRVEQWSRQDWERLWTDLAGEDAAKAYRALWTLVGTPKQSLPLFRTHLKPVPPADARHLHRLIEGLDNDEFDVRENSARALEELGEKARGALLRARDGQASPEVRKRVEALLEKLDGTGASADTRVGRRAVQALEQMGGRDARRLLQDLARGAPGARLTTEAQEALNRLAKRDPDVAP